jgi:hypothetical protein
MVYTLTKDFAFYLNDFKAQANKVLYITRGIYFQPASLQKLAADSQRAQVIPPEIQPQLLKSTCFVLNRLVEFVAAATDIELSTTTTTNLTYEQIREQLKLTDFAIPTTEIVPQWSHAYWSFLHASSIILYFRGTPIAWDLFKSVFLLMYLILPCGICQVNFKSKDRKAWIQKFTVDIIEGMFNFHNLVTVSKQPAGRPISKEDFLKLYHVSDDTRTSNIA